MTVGLEAQLGSSDRLTGAPGTVQGMPSRPSTPPVERRFRGRIMGVGTTSGVRIVVGMWERSPFGAFTDVFLELADGTSVLLAPDELVAAYVSGTYRFDSVSVVDVRTRRTGRGSNSRPAHCRHRSTSARSRRSAGRSGSSRSRSPETRGGSRWSTPSRGSSHRAPRPPGLPGTVAASSTA
ncbi:hypothetical protein P9139_19260 [Curtobacterium flaccumfaciens]|nr:hypothetical protein P9139_19260 [Curtobacterium flaccumfaciens]